MLHGNFKYYFLSLQRFATCWFLSCACEIQMLDFKIDFESLNLHKKTQLVRRICGVFALEWIQIAAAARQV